MSKDISLILPPQNDLGALYISDIRTAQTLPWLKEQKIGAILTVVRDKKLSHPTEDIPTYLCLAAQDKDSFNISQYFEISTSFIAESRKNTNVLVHCIAGISRSATIIAAYLINTYGYSPQQAIALMQKQRPKVLPNKGFRKQLQNINNGLSRQKTEEAATIPMETAKDMPIEGQKFVETACKNARQKNTQGETIRITHSSLIKRSQRIPYAQNNIKTGLSTAGNVAVNEERKDCIENRDEKGHLYKQIDQLQHNFRGLVKIYTPINQNQWVACSNLKYIKIRQEGSNDFSHQT